MPTKPVPAPAPAPASKDEVKETPASVVKVMNKAGKTFEVSKSHYDQYKHELEIVK